MGESSRRMGLAESFFLILLIIIFTIQTVFQQYQKISFGLMLLIILLSFIKYAVNRFKIKNENLRVLLTVYCRNNIGIKIIIHAYTIILILLNLTDKDIFSTNLMTYINAVSAIAIVYLLREKAWNISIVALVSTWVISLIITAIRYESDFFHHLEFNDLAFGTGFFIIFFAVFKKKWQPKELVVFTIACIITVITAKRIAIGVLFLVILFHYLFVRKTKTLHSKQGFLTGVGIVAILLSYAFIYIIVDESIFTFLSKRVHSIESFLMGRNYYWKVLGRLCEFKVGFLGYGKNASATLFSSEYAYMNVGNVHSDILRNFMEDGFILFGIWLFQYFVRFRKSIAKKIGDDNSYIYFLFTLYVFGTYFTDNTEAYLMTQYFYMLLPVVCALKGYRYNGKYM